MNKPEDAIEVLERWVNGHKARHVHAISIDDGYGATCWRVVLARHTTAPWPKGWQKLQGKEYRNEYNHYIYAAECSFLQLPKGKIPLKNIGVC
jgi:hypothetical protein